MAIRSHDYDSPSGRCKVSVTTEIIITRVTDNLVNMFHTDLSILSVYIRCMLSIVMYCEKYYFEYILSLMKCKSNENKSVFEGVFGLKISKQVFELRLQFHGL